MGMLLKVQDVWKKNSLFNELNGEWVMYSAGDCVWVTLVDMFVGILMIHGVNGGYGVGQRKL